jgi:hypothetical protein
MLLAAALLTLSPAPSQPPAPVTYVTYAGQSQGRCQYSTGDVIFDARQFEEDLRARFDRAANIVVFHDANVLPDCLATALAIARRVGFRNVRGEIAPPHLDMGPPR